MQGEDLSALVVTVSTSKYARKVKREEIDDGSGDIAEKTLRKSGYSRIKRNLISDDRQMLEVAARTFLEGDRDIAVFVGGTGLSPTDVTIESIRPFFERELEGFGEILRDRSYEKVGSAAFLTRATAGIAEGKLIICLPGSPDAVETGLRLFSKVFPSAVQEARSQPGDPEAARRSGRGLTRRNHA